jgi:hypothetical protein
MARPSDIQAAGHLAIARFLRTLSASALDLARELEATTAQSTMKSLDDAGLGSLQRQVAAAPGMDSEAGVSPRVITKHLGRNDEPNIRTALMAMQKRGVTELVPDVSPQRWRLTPAYRRQLPAT